MTQITFPDRTTATTSYITSYSKLYIYVLSHCSLSSKFNAWLGLGELGFLAPDILSKAHRRHTAGCWGRPGRINFVTVHLQFVFVILSLPKTLHHNGDRHLNMIEMSLGKIRRPRLFTETQMSPTLSTSRNVSAFIKQIEWPWLWFFLSIPTITLNSSVNIKDFLYRGYMKGFTLILFNIYATY